ncbi:MAG: glycosyltransferase family 4 protein [Pirellulales bacterium]
MRYVLRNARSFDVILAQEVTRGALAANLGAKLRGVPCFNYMGIAPIEYFQCRWERRVIPYWKHLLGTTTIRLLMTINGRLATGWLGMGPYLRDIGKRYSANSLSGGYYGVDVDAFRPASAEERLELRKKRELPTDAFLVFFSSRISHEKDPETVLKAVSLARSEGLNAVILNLGGGFRDFLALAKKLNLPDVENWVIGRPAAHPMRDVADYFRCADVMALASLAEGAAFSTLEALSCGTPVVATAVGGMAVQLTGHARLVPRQDAAAMASQFIDIARNPDIARREAEQARETYIIPYWEKTRTFQDLLTALSAGRKN